LRTGRRTLTQLRAAHRRLAREATDAKRAVGRRRVPQRSWQRCGGRVGALGGANWTARAAQVRARHKYRVATLYLFFFTYTKSTRWSYPILWLMAPTLRRAAPGPQHPSPRSVTHRALGIGQLPYTYFSHNPVNRVELPYTLPPALALSAPGGRTCPISPC
jgi:hypothetical protein